MKKKKKVLSFAACILISGLFLASGAAAETSEQDCIHGGGYVSEKAGCKFCVGGKNDLAVVKDGGKESTPRPDLSQKNGEKNQPKPEKSGEN